MEGTTIKRMAQTCVARCRGIPVQRTERSDGQAGARDRWMCIFRCLHIWACTPRRKGSVPDDARPTVPCGQPRRLSVRRVAKSPLAVATV